MQRGIFRITAEVIIQIPHVVGGHLGDTAKFDSPLRSVLFVTESAGSQWEQTE